jgi:hypothetical protein
MALHKPRPGSGSLPAPRAYTPKTGGGHAAQLARFAQTHQPSVQNANDIIREREKLHAPKTDTDESPP